MIGCFGLTEHSGGSDPGAMGARARRDGDSYVLNGVKVWISYGSIADIAIIWAKGRRETAPVRGFVVPTDTTGFTATTIERQMSLRMSVASELALEDVRVPAYRDAPGGRRTVRAAIVPHPGALRHLLGCSGRPGVRL